MAQFIGYHIDCWDTDKTVPISIGTTREEAQSLAIRRTLAACELMGSIGVQQRDDIDAETFTKIGTFLDEWFKGKGIEV